MQKITSVKYLQIFLSTVLVLALVLFIIVLPYGFWWLYNSGDVAMQDVIQRSNTQLNTSLEQDTLQAQTGDFILFNPNFLNSNYLTQEEYADIDNIFAYKLALYDRVRPKIIALGSTRILPLRNKYFTDSFINMGGTVKNISSLRHAVNEILKLKKPEIVILGIDFWWFTKQWEKDPFNNYKSFNHNYTYSLKNMLLPWQGLLKKQLSPKEFFAPILGLSSNENFYGLYAKRYRDGFGADGSWYSTSIITGQRKPFDFQFQDSLQSIQYNQGYFAPLLPKTSKANETDDLGPMVEFTEPKDLQALSLSETHLDAFAEVVYKLKARGIKVYTFIAPMAQRLWQELAKNKLNYPQFYNLGDSLRERGIEYINFGNPNDFGSNDCEFLAGIYGGEVTYARVLRDLADHYSQLFPYVRFEKLEKDIDNWQGYAGIADPMFNFNPEIDFMELSCPKR